jgi:hypothetical protein
LRRREKPTHALDQERIGLGYSINWIGIRHLNLELSQTRLFISPLSCQENAYVGALPALASLNTATGVAAGFWTKGNEDNEVS